MDMMIRNILMVALAMASSICANATATDPDTVLSVNGARNVIIKESPDGFELQINGSKGDSLAMVTYSESFDSDVTVKSRFWRSILKEDRYNVDKWSLRMGGPGIGWTNACGAPDGMGFEMGKSLEISWLNALSVSYDIFSLRSSISVGIGFDWRNYKITTDRRLTFENGVVGSAPYPEGAVAYDSRLKVFSMGFPVLYRQNLGFKVLGENAQLSIGAIFNYNGHASIKTRWRDAMGHKSKESYDHVGQRKFSIDYIVMARLCGFVGVYARYSPMTVLQGAGQPEFRPFSTGLICFW